MKKLNIHIQKIVRSGMLLAFFCLILGVRAWNLYADICQMSDLPEKTTVRITGTIVKKEQKDTYIVYYLKHNSVTVKTAQASIWKLLLTCEQTEELLPLGSTITVNAQIKSFHKARNEGAFDEAAYYHSLGVAGRGVQNGSLTIEKRPGIFLQERLYQFRMHMKEVYDTALNQKDAGVLAAMILGDKSSMDAEWKQLYSETGIAHILAVSGLHISILGMGLYRCLRKRKCPYAIAAAVSGTGVLLFCIMSGNSVSTMRAGMMFALFLGAELTGRTYDSLRALFLAGVLLLVYQPYYLVNAGFQFSFLAVASVAAAKKLHTDKKQFQKAKAGVQCKNTLQSKQTEHGKENKNTQQSKRDKWKKNWAEKLMVSLFIQLFTLPLTAWYYYEVPLFAIAANFLVLPLTGVLMQCGLAAGVAGLLFYRLSLWIFLPCHWILKFYELVCRFTQAIPHATMITGRPSIIWMLAYYGGLLFWICYKKREPDKKGKTGKIGKTDKTDKTDKTGKTVFPALRSIIPLGLFVLLFFQNQWGSFGVYFLDVGQGDGICIRSEKGKTFFIDGGSSSEQNVGTYQLLPFLKYHGIRQVDAWFLSHGDTDHISGCLEAMEAGYPIQGLYLSTGMPHDQARALIEEQANHAKIPVFEIGAQDVIRTDALTITCVTPECETGDTSYNPAAHEADSTVDVNAKSMVLKLEYQGVTGLFTGDIASEQEAKLLTEHLLGTENTIDFLKAAHHGSKYSNSEAFLKETAPQLILISAGENNRYGHPHPEALERMQAIHAQVLQTKEQGEIRMTIEKKNGKETIICHSPCADSMLK